MASSVESKLRDLLELAQVVLDDLGVPARMFGSIFGAATAYVRVMARAPPFALASAREMMSYTAAIIPAATSIANHLAIT